MTHVNVQGVQARLPELLERVEEGQPIAITRNGLVVADLVPRATARKRTGRGVWGGEVDMSRFDEADEEIAREFGMLDSSSLLLDSHTLIWWFEDHPQLSPPALHAIEVQAHHVLVSAASVMEIEIKRQKGKLTAPDDLLDQVENAGFRLLDVTADNALDAARLPRHHGDPFDRLLIAQAQAEAATLVTDDAAIAAYDVPVMRARR